jgi:glycerophosphoryl diester phosphodiesterase
MPTFDLQGHRGARGLRPENTLPSFEAAFDAGVSSVETDLHRTADGVVVLCHEPVLAATEGLLAPGSAPGEIVPIRSLSLAELRRHRLDRNPDPARFPGQSADVPELARAFAAERGFDVYAAPTLADLFAFAAAYAGEPGRRAGKTDGQRRRAGRVRFDLELKRVPFFPETIHDGFDGTAPAALEREVVAAVRAAGVVGRVLVRSFDHRCVRLLRELELGLTGAVLIADTAPADPVALVLAAGGEVYCPSYWFLDEREVRRVRAAGLRVVPWTVNDPEHMGRLLDWGVDGITTDYPDRLAALLDARGIAY